MSDFIIYKSAFGVDHEVISKRSGLYNPEARRMQRNKVETAGLATGSVAASIASVKTTGINSTKVKRSIGNAAIRYGAGKKVIISPSFTAVRKPAAYAAGAAALGAGAVLNARDRSRGGRPYKTWYS